MTGYSEDLACIHDAGFGEFARKSAPGLLRILRRNGITGGLVVDLGCGSGIWARELSRAGYDVLAVDISASMIRLARKKAPGARFLHASLLRVKLPPCEAITSIGECVSYSFDRANRKPALIRLFRRAHESLRPGGVFVFDIAQPGQIPVKTVQRKYFQADDFVVFVEAREGRQRRMLTRRIVSFRRLGKLYRKSEETHRLRLYRGSDLLVALRRIGFRARLLSGYGSFRLSGARVVILARKPRKRR